MHVYVANNTRMDRVFVDKCDPGGEINHPIKPELIPRVKRELKKMLSLLL